MQASTQSSSIPDAVSSIKAMVGRLKVEATQPALTPAAKQHVESLLAPYVTMFANFTEQIRTLSSMHGELAPVGLGAIPAELADLDGLVGQLLLVAGSAGALSAPQTTQILSVLQMLESITATVERQIPLIPQIDSSMHGEGQRPGL